MRLECRRSRLTIMVGDALSKRRVRVSVACCGRLETGGVPCALRGSRSAVQAVHVADGRWHVVELRVANSTLCVTVDGQACDEPKRLVAREVRGLRFQSGYRCVGARSPPDQTCCSNATGVKVGYDVAHVQLNGVEKAMPHVSGASETCVCRCARFNRVRRAQSSPLCLGT